MQLNFKNLAFAVCAGTTFAALAAPKADAIIITEGNSGVGTTDNVLFNDGSLNHSGLVVQGNFNGSGSAFTIDFTSSSGTGQLIGTGGQATVLGGTGNDPLTNLCFELEDGATFTQAILNPDASVDGTIDFTVSYIGAAGSPHTESFSLDGNGQNFFNVLAEGSERITEICIDTTDSTILNVAQIRIGGFNTGVIVDPRGLPEGGVGIALFGLALAGMGFARKALRKA